MNAPGRILIVDEDPLVRMALRDTVENDGHFVRTAASAEDALRQLATPYDLLLLHRRLPDSTCDEIVRMARELHPNPAVVLMSSEQSSDLERNKLRLGAVEIVYKPLSPLDIRALIERHLQIPEPEEDDAEGAPRILVVDDQELILMAIQDSLENRFPSIECTTSAKQALERLREQPFEILLTDLMMAEMTGLELVRAAKNLRPTLQAIIMTGYASKDSAIAALKEGAFDLIEKPFTPDGVLQTVARTWKMTRYEIENRRLLKALQRSNDDLRTARDAAEEASRLKGLLLTNMSHEFRTPLNGILGSLNLLRDQISPDGREFLDIAHKSGMRLLGLLDNFLSLSELESGRPEFFERPFSLHDLLQKTLDENREKASAAGLELELKLAPDLPRQVQGASYRLQQILDQLLDNAIKFTPQGKVTVESQVVSDDPNRIRFAVTDTGIGIEPDETLDLFAPFVQADSSTARRHGGAGVGLAICRRLVDYLDGQIGYESAAGQGSTFWFVLPLTPA